MDSRAGSPALSPSPSPPDFMLEKYKADRTHELELNKVQGAIEATALFGLIFLNVRQSRAEGPTRAR